MYITVIVFRHKIYVRIIERVSGKISWFLSLHGSLTPFPKKKERIRTWNPPCRSVVTSESSVCSPTYFNGLGALHQEVSDLLRLKQNCFVRQKKCGSLERSSKVNRANIPWWIFPKHKLKIYCCLCVTVTLISVKLRTSGVQFQYVIFLVLGNSIIGLNGLRDKLSLRFL